jgi:hypothetical protein
MFLSERHFVEEWICQQKLVKRYGSTYMNLWGNCWLATTRSPDDNAWT